MKTLTVFTPTYNRLHTITRTYESLCHQTSDDFNWLVIDDGSSDGTRAWIESLGSMIENSGPLFDWMGRIVENDHREKPDYRLKKSSDHFFIQAPNVCIEYIYKPNGGLYTGYNVAYQTIVTELCVCVDSDDYMPDDAVEKIAKLWQEKGGSGFCGILGLDFDIRNQEPIGGYFPQGMVSAYFGDLHHEGDTKPVFLTALMKEVAPMIGFEGERDFNPHYMQMQILDQYPILLMNEVLCFVEYQIGADSMSQGIYKQYLRSPHSYAKLRLMEMQVKHGLSTKRLMTRHIHYVSSCFFAHDKSWLKNSPNKWLTMVLAPLGGLMSLFILYKNK